MALNDENAALAVPFTALYRSLDSSPSKRGKQFERIVKWFLKSDPEWATQVDEVWLWDEWPQRWGADCGIDIVFRHKNGEHWAVQAKCYSPDYTVTKHDVDRFLSESNRALIQRRLLVATTDRIGANAIRVCEAQEKSVVIFRLSDFNNSSLDFPADIALLPQTRRKPRPVPRDHQREAIVAVTDGLQSADRGQLIMACGTGKTYVTLWIKEALNAQRTLVLVPSLGLLSQLLREWTFAASVPFELLCVCSDESVGTKGGDDTIHSLTDLAFPVTSNAAEIGRFLGGAGNRVVISTYQSSLIVAKAQNEPGVPDFDLAIADEAHRCAGKVGGDFSTILNNEQIRSAKRLFATATPRTYSRSVKTGAEARGVEVVGMDDNALFGAVLYALPFGKAIERKLLTDYRVVIIGVDDATIAQWIDQRKLVSTGTGVETDSESLAAQIGLLKAMKDYDLRRVISFHSRVSRAENFITELRKVSDWISDEHRPSGDLHADFVSGNMPAGKRKVKLDRLKELRANERAVLSNARCLAEGVDVPSLDGVAFIDPRSSHVDIVQAVGRAIRLSPEKRTGTIILPVFLKSAGDAVSAIEASNFKPIWEVLDALKAHDDVLAWDLDQIRTEMGRTPGTGVSAGDLGKVGISLPSTVDESFGTALRTYLVEQVTVSWNFWFGLLEAYVRENGSAWVPVKHVTRDGYKLGMWINGQRDSKLKNQLSQDRISRLESLPGWVWNAYEGKWEIGFAKLIQYVKKYGSADVPLAHVTPDEYKLGGWVSNVRRNRIENQISPARISKLQSLPGWSWGEGVLDERWEKGFRFLEQYVDLAGNARVPARHITTSGYKLGRWAEGQRRLWTSQSLDQGRAQRLEAFPGWFWESKKIGPRGMPDWEEAFKRLIEYQAREGHFLVPQHYKTADGLRLGNWLKYQRRTMQAMPPDRKRKLEELPGWSWNVLGLRGRLDWEEAFKRLIEYQAREGHVLVPQPYETADGLRLGNWVKYQRSAMQCMPPDRKRKLEELPGWSWNVLDLRGMLAWEKAFIKLIEYQEREGHVLVPQHYETADGLRLGDWVNYQRRTMQGMPPDRKRKLEELPGWSWNVLGLRGMLAWDEAFMKLIEYQEREGHFLVPQHYETADGLRLGYWVNYQRRTMQGMPPDRKRKLEELPGWSWNVCGLGATPWESAIRDLREFVQNGGHARVPKHYRTKDGFRLGGWVQKQRSKVKWLPSELKVQLEALPGWAWNALSDRWEDGLRHLTEFAEREGHARVKQDFVAEDGYRLGSWAQNQRARRENLSSERRTRLEALPGWMWAADSLRWDDWIDLLKEFSRQNGHTRVPQLFKTSDGLLLGRWVNSRRTSRDRLAPNQQSELESLPGWVWRVS